MTEQKPEQSIGDEERQAGTRRRGEALETAILQAAWNELAEVGYNHVTMEGVAARAETNKAVLYRRWPNKAKLIIATLQKYMPRPVVEVPNSGDLRNDLITLFQGILQPLQMIGANTIRGLMVEELGKDLIASLPQIMRSNTENKLTAAIVAILKNAELRGEVKLEKISKRVIALPVNLFQFELLITQAPMSDETITEIIDNIFLPLVRNSQG
jgi:AcrR family transcriptional regulator